MQGSQEERATCVAGLAACISDQGRRADAEELYYQALTLFEGMESSQAARATCTVNLAACIEQQSRHDEAEKLFRDALTLYEGMEGSQAARALCTMNLATSIQQQSRHYEAENFYRRALTLFEDVEGSEAARARCTTGLASCLDLQGKLSVKSRQKYLDYSRSVFTKLGLTAELHHFNAVEAALIERQARTIKDPQEKKQLLERALALAAPAAFDADVRRYQFDTESKRLTWMESTAAPRIALAFQLAVATGNAALISDLIAIWRTAGTISHDAETHTVPGTPSSSPLQADTLLGIALTNDAYSGDPEPWGPSLTAGSEFSGPKKQPEHQLKRKPSPILLMPHRTRPAASGYTTQTEPTSTHYR